MKTDRGTLILTAVFAVLTVSFYTVHILLFKDWKTLSFYTFMDVAFLPVQVFMTVIVLNRITAMREKTARRQKLNMIVGVFYSEIGSRLLREISRADTALDSIRPRLLESGRETLSLELFQNYKPAIDPARLPLQELKGSCTPAAIFYPAFLKTRQ